MIPQDYITAWSRVATWPSQQQVEQDLIAFADLLDGPERAVLHAKTALVLQKHDAIPTGEAVLAAFDRQAHVIAQIAGVPHPLARCLIERAHLLVGVGENDAAFIGRRLPFAVPAVYQVAARLLACFGGMDHAVIVICQSSRWRRTSPISAPPRCSRPGPHGPRISVSSLINPHPIGGRTDTTRKHCWYRKPVSRPSCAIPTSLPTKWLGWGDTQRYGVGK